jgi:hypothetical protein
VVSPGSAAVLHGLPLWRVPARVHGGTGDVLARCDFGWEDRRTVAEFDGRVRYGRLLRPGQEPGDAVFEAKSRLDTIRDAGQ